MSSSPTELGLVPPMTERADSSVLASILSKWSLVIAFAIGGMLIALSFAIFGSPSYLATTNIVVEDPRMSDVSGQGGATNAERYVADQVEILRSFAVAERAAAKLAESGLEQPLPSAQDLMPDAGHVTIESPPNSNVIGISVTDRRANVARQGSEAILEAYREIRAEEATASSASALQRVDERIADLDEQLATIAGQIQSTLPQEMRDAIQAQNLAVLSRIIELEAALLTASTPETVAAITTQLTALTESLAATDAIVGAFAPADMQSLLDQQTALITRRADLVSQRDAIAVNSELASTGVTFVSPPAEPTRNDLSPAIAGALGLVLGLILGAAFARWLVLRERRVTDSTQAGQILGSPLVGDIPLFGHERIESPLPVRDRSSTATAESFRFAASSLAVRLRNMDASSVGVVSGRVEDGKTTLAANLGFAVTRLAQKGSRVLLVDADFGAQSLARMLGTPGNSSGLTDVAVGRAPLSLALQEVDWPGAGSLYLLAKGQQPVDPQSFFASDEARQLFEKLADDFDLVVVDTPPLLQVAYASTIAGLTDGTLIVARHGADSTELAEMRNKLALLGSPSVGYVYTKAPMKEWMSQDTAITQGDGLRAKTASTKRVNDEVLERQASDRIRRL